MSNDNSIFRIESRRRAGLTRIRCDSRYDVQREPVRTSVINFPEDMKKKFSSHTLIRFEPRFRTPRY